MRLCSRWRRALQGLTLDEARYALRRALAASPKLGPESIPALLEEKRFLVNRSGTVEFIAEGGSMSHIGGLEGLKKWLTERRKLFQMRDSLSADIAPKGLLMMGIPGCGKSLSVKAIASYFDLPLYRIDMIEIFSGRHGKPEGAFVAACKMLEDMSPAVLWFDEIEMGITSTESSGEQGRIFAFFLTWMQEKSRGLFVAATANRIDLLPAEMIRKGRFDEVFFVDLPLDDERIEIFKIHLSQRGIDPALIQPRAAYRIHHRLDRRRNRAVRGLRAHQGQIGRPRHYRGRSARRGGEHRAVIAHHEGADQSHPKLGVRTGRARFAASWRPVVSGAGS